MGKFVKTYRELDVYREAFQLAMEVFELTKKIPVEERYSLTDQFRRSSRSVCANIAEAWRKRRYKAAFIAKLSDSETEAGESQVWSEFSEACKYIDKNTFDGFIKRYDVVIGKIVRMITDADKWLIK